MVGDPIITIAQMGTPSKTGQVKQSAAAPIEQAKLPEASFEDLDSLLKDTRRDSYEKRAAQFEPRIAGMTADQWHGTVAGLLMTRHLRHTPQYKAFKESLLASLDDTAKAATSSADDALKAAASTDDALKTAAGNLDDLLHFSTNTDEIARTGGNIDELLRAARASAGQVTETVAEQGSKTLMQRVGSGLRYAGNNKVKVGGIAFDAANLLYIANRHTTRFGYDPENKEKVLQTYNGKFMYDTSREDEFLDVYSHEGNVKREDGKVETNVPLAQAVIYQFHEDGRITRRDGDYIETNGRNDAEIQKRSRQEALQVPQNEVELVKVNEEIENLTNDFTTLTNAVSNFTEKQLESSSVRKELTNLGHRLNAKLNLVNRFLKHQGDAIDLAKRDELKASLELLKTEATRIPSLDQGMLNKMISASINPKEVSDSKTGAENPKEEQEVAITLKNPANLDASQKSKLVNLVKELEQKFNSTQEYLTKQKRANNPTANSLAADGLITDNNYDRVVGMMEGDIIDGSNYADQELRLSKKEREAFETFLESGSGEDLNLPSMLKALKKISPNASVEAEPKKAGTEANADTASTSSSSAVTENNTEANLKLTNIWKSIMKDAKARESDFGKVGIWLYENKDQSPNLVAKLSSESNSDIDYLIKNIPNKFNLKRPQGEHTISDMRKAVTDLKALFKHGANLRTELTKLLEQNGSN